MFLTGTLLNVVTVLVGTGIGLLLGRRLPALLLAPIFIRVADAVRGTIGP